MRTAATVLLLRDSERGLEVFMEQRHIKSDFVGGAYVFPGGAVDEEDRVDSSLCAGLDDETASSRLGLDHGGLAYWVAAIRECFEEAGVLLAYDRSGGLLDFDDPATEERFKRLRDRMNAGDLGIEQLAREEDLMLATDQVSYWSHWVTPAGQPRRYDTRFFVAHAPERQVATHDDWELTSSAWVTPREALDKGAAREWMIIFPTVKNLIDLGRYSDAEAVVAAARGHRGVPRNQPRVVLSGDEPRVVLPEDDGYDQADEDVSAVDPRIWFAWVEEYQELLAKGWGMDPST